jgi:ubiquinone/menaquinone biosynthesis C-methylase UbiE
MMIGSLESGESRLRPVTVEGGAQLFPAWERRRYPDDGRRMSVSARLLLKVGRLFSGRGEAKTREDNPEEFTAVQRERFARFLGLLGGTIDFAGKRVIELGAGAGGQTRSIADHSPAVVAAIEPHPAFARIATTTLGDGPSHAFVVRADGESLPFPSDYFHFAILNDLIEHVSDPVAILSETYRVLTPGGSALIAFVPWYSPYGGHTWEFLPLPWGHLLYSTKVTAEMRSSMVGWHTTEMGATGLYKVSLKRFLRMVAQSEFELASQRNVAIRNQQWLARIPVLRELVTSIFTAHLVKPRSTP